MLQIDMFKPNNTGNYNFAEKRDTEYGSVGH